MDVRVRLLAAALAALAVCASPAAAAPGDLDASFSGDGRVSTLTSPDTFVARAVAMQPDGRIVVAGYSCNTGTCGPTGDSSFRLLRYTSDGGLDTDFGQGGMVTTTVGVGRSQAFDVIVRADGSIVAGGVASADALDPGSFALVGYKPNGTLDTTFGTGGRVITRVGDGLRRDLRPRAGLRRPLHRGRAGQRRHARPLRARPLRPPRQAGPELRRHGERRRPDLGALRLRRGRRAAPRRARGRGRRVRQQRGDREPALQRHRGRLQRRRDAAVDPPGRRVLLVRERRGRAGRRARAVGGRRHRAARQPGDGAHAHEPGRRARPHVGRRRAGDWRAPATARWPATSCSTPRGARWRPATRRSGADHEFAVARFDGAGALDRSFGGGVVLTSFPGTSRARATAIARQADGKLVVAGIACSSGSGAQCSGGTARLALARYLGRPGGGAAPGRRHAAAGHARRSSSRCPRG